MQEETIFKVALSLTSGVGNVVTRQLISYCGSASGVFRSPRGKLLKIPGIGPKTADSILGKEALIKAEGECEKASKAGVELLFYTDAAYPARLRQIADAPTLLYAKGRADFNAQKTIAIVGTRQATTYGKEITENIVADLKEYESVVIISGLAYGIDITAHKAALKRGIPTIGVIASGIDIIYPAAHKNIAAQMAETGAILTEYPFETKPDAPYFPARNRIIAGLADVVIVVEAAKKGGALITAELANDYNREVFAVPGNLGASHSEGCNLLIKDLKANIFTSTRDLEIQMNWEEKKLTSQPQTGTLSIEDSGLTGDEKQIIILLRNQIEMPIDDLCWQSQIPVGKMASLLLSLELKGMVKALPGKRFTIPGRR